MHRPWQHFQQSILALSVATMAAASAPPVRGARPLEDAVAPEPAAGPETFQLENFGLHPRWMPPSPLLSRVEEQGRSFAVFRLAQVAAEQRAVEPALVAGEKKPSFRMRLPEVRDAVPPASMPAEPETAGPRAESAPSPNFRRARLDLRERDPMERPSLLKPFAGRWLEESESGLFPIQIPASTPVLPAGEPGQVMPVPAPGPEIPTAPATTEFPKPELFPNGDSPTTPFALPWGTATGSGVAPRSGSRGEVEPEPEVPRALPEELPLRRQTSAWDLAELESPLFGTEQIAEFTRKINSTGAWAVRPHFTTTALYDGNVFLSEDDQQSDFIITAMPGVTARIGNDQTPFLLTADYTMGAIIFVDRTDESSLNHNARLELDWRGARTSLGFRVGFENDSGSSIDASDRVRRTGYNAGLESRYQHSEKFSLDLNGDFRRAYFEDLIGSQDYGVQTWANYHYSPKLILGLGGGYTASEVETGRSQHAQNVSMRASWTATGKLTIDGTLGIGFFQFSDGEPDAIAPIASLRATYVATQKLTFSGDVGVGIVRFDSDGNTLTPTFNIDATWAVWQGTALTFNAHSRVFNSVVFVDQNFISTGFVVGLTQQLGIRFVGFVTAGYENLTYVAAGGDAEADRQDNFFFARFGLQWQVNNRCSVGMFYEFNENSSEGQDARGFRRDRTGVQMSILF